MTLDEAVGRVLRRHLALLALCLVLPVAVLVAVHNPQKEFLAAARLQIPGGPASSTTQADAISNQAAALATNPAYVQQALREAGVRRAPLLDYIKHNISVVRQGESTVIDLTVTDTNKTVAALVDRTLAYRVVQFINGSNQTSVPGALADIDHRLAEVRAEQTKIQTNLNRSPNDPKVPEWQAQLYLVSQEHADLNTERSQIVIEHAMLPQALLVDAHEPVVLDSTFPQLLALAVLLGMFLGLVASSVVELFRPTVPNPRALARLLDTPLLGRLHGRRLRLPEVEQAALTTARAAHRAGVSTVAVVPVPADATRFAGELAGRLRGIHLPTDAGPLTWTTADRVAGDALAGVLLVAPYSVKRRALEPAEDLRTAAGWPVLGVLTVPRRALRAGRAEKSRTRRVAARADPDREARAP